MHQQQTRRVKAEVNRKQGIRMKFQRTRRWWLTIKRQQKQHQQRNHFQLTLTTATMRRQSLPHHPLQISLAFNPKSSNSKLTNSKRAYRQFTNCRKVLFVLPKNVGNLTIQRNPSTGLVIICAVR